MTAHQVDRIMYRAGFFQYSSVGGHPAFNNIIDRIDTYKIENLTSDRACFWHICDLMKAENLQISSHWIRLGLFENVQFKIVFKNDICLGVGLTFGQGYPYTINIDDFKFLQIFKYENRELLLNEIFSDINS